MDGKPIGIIANQPRIKGGVLFHDSADKAAKFIIYAMHSIFHYYSLQMYLDL